MPKKELKVSKTPKASKISKVSEISDVLNVAKESEPVKIAAKTEVETSQQPAVTHERAEENNKQSQINIQPNRLWIFVLFLGWVSDFLFWKHSAGVNFAVFSILCLFGGLGILLAEGYKPARNGLWLLFPFTFFVFTTFMRKEPLTSFLAYTFTFFSAGVFANTYLGGRWFQYGLIDYFGSFFKLIFSMFSRQWIFLFQARKQRLIHNDIQKKFPIVALLRGLLIALPVVACFASLLASADVVFNQKIADFFDLFEAGKIFEYIARLILILIYAYLLMGAVLHAASQSRDEKLAGESGPVIKPFFGFTEASVVIGSVAILFLLFVIVQFQYFFGGQTNIGVAGYTYSEYARSGFNELVLVAFFSLLFIMGLSTITKRENETQRKAYSWLSVAIVLEVLVILTSAYQRLSLAIDWHGFSRLRLYPSVFLIWVGILFVAIVFLEIFRKENYFALAFVLASLGFAVTLTTVNVDAAIIRRNVARVEAGKHFNPGHLASLSTDAIPELANFYHSPDISEETHIRLGAVLLCYINSDEINLNEEVDWRSFNYSYWKATQLLEEVQPLLANYKVSGRGRTLLVRDPNNIQYECQGEY